jgi:hypothetical protein
MRDHQVSRSASDQKLIRLTHLRKPAYFALVDVRNSSKDSETGKVKSEKTDRRPTTADGRIATGEHRGTALTLSRWCLY